MSLDVETPPPPTLDAERQVDDYDDVEVVGADDYHREDLQRFLEEGAWERAFGEWAEHTDLSELEFEVAVDLGLFDEFDFFWDDFADRVGYHAPGIPEDWRERNLHPSLDSWGQVSNVNASLAELGRTVSDLLKAEYVDWEADYEAPDDLPDF